MAVDDTVSAPPAGTIWRVRARPRLGRWLSHRPNMSA